MSLLVGRVYVSNILDENKQRKVRKIPQGVKYVPKFYKL